MKKFNAFDPVLVRANSNMQWHADFYDYMADGDKGHWCIASALVKDENILPYNEETKHLHHNVGEFTKWVPKKGEPILVRDMDNERWNVNIFIGMEGEYFVGITDPEVPHLSCNWVQAKPYINPFKE